MPIETFWVEATGVPLAQGDYLTGCPVPILPSNFNIGKVDATISIRRADLIVMTQSCDLENSKVQLVAMCPILSIAQLASTDERYGKPDRLEESRKGRIEALHMLSSPRVPDDHRDARIVDFREIHSLPVEFLIAHANSLGKRWRLRSPYLEHFSQAFARFFMRVGLPSAISRFK